MPLPFRPACQPTQLGPLPHPTAHTAWDAALRATPHLPALPLLAPDGETPALVAGFGVAGVTFGAPDPFADRATLRQGFDTLYAAYLRGTLNGERLDLAGLERITPAEQPAFKRARAVFGLVLGPISLALLLVDDQAVPLLNDADLLDALAKHIFLRRQWLAAQLERTGKPAIIWLYEPFADVVASPFCPIDQTHLVDALDQALGVGLTRALWLSDSTAAALLDELALDLIGLPLPAPATAQVLAASLRRLIKQRAAVAWGIVPVTAEGLDQTTVGKLAARFAAWLQALATADVPTEAVLHASLIMPEDTLAHADVPHAERALALTAELASLIKQSYGVD